MENTRILKVGIIGCGGIANGKHMPALKNLPDVEMVAFCDIIPEKAETAARSKENDEQRAMAYKENVLPKMEALRRAVDSMEVLTAREYWPVPTYGDLTYRV